LEVEISPTRRIIVLGVDRRSPNNIGWCAITYGANRLFWVDSAWRSTRSRLSTRLRKESFT